jgi:hypothetical protein
MRWGKSNAFPGTLRNLIAQSPIAKPAVERTAAFYKGSGFVGEDEIVSPYGLTLKKVVDILADDYATYRAFAIHCNYNLRGQVTSIMPMRIADLRFNEFDELNMASQVGYYYNFGRTSEIKKTVDQTATKTKIKWFDRFNPKAVIKQIRNTKGGISNYLGQVLYHSDAGHSSYPIPPLQAPINYVLSDIENSILIRKETATGFINTYLLKTSMDSEDPSLIALENAIDDAQGARGSGKVITFSGLAPEDVNATILEELGGGGQGSKAIVDAAVVTFELSQKVIFGAYLIPPVLGGADQKNGFSGTNLEDAYFVFNAVTQHGRDTIQSEINRVLSNSIFETKEIVINKLKLDTDEEEVTPELEGKAEGAKPESSFKNLTGKQMQQLQRIVRKFVKEEISFEQAKQLLKDGFDMTDDQVDVWLVKEEEEVKDV